MTKREMPEHISWRMMKERCLSPTNQDYLDYGGKGIGIEDPRWMKFENFYADMGPRPKGTTIDRLDGSRGYCKDNCRWATSLEQCINRSSTVFITYHGRTLPLCHWAPIVGVSRSVISRRYIRGLRGDDLMRPPTKPQGCGYRFLTFRGETRTICGWAKKVGITPPAIYRRMNLFGMSLEDAIFTPKTRWQSYKRPA